jgi:hypothetical protein
MKQHIQHVGVLSLPCGDYDLFDYYPVRNSRNYKILSVVPVGSLTRSGESFLSEAAFERWLERNIAPVQRALF